MQKTKSIKQSIVDYDFTALKVTAICENTQLRQSVAKREKVTRIRRKRQCMSYTTFNVYVISM